MIQANKSREKLEKGLTKHQLNVKIQWTEVHRTFIKMKSVHDVCYRGRGLRGRTERLVTSGVWNSLSPTVWKIKARCLCQRHRRLTDTHLWRWGWGVLVGGCARSGWSTCRGHRRWHPPSLSEGCTRVCPRLPTRWTRAGPPTICRSLRIWCWSGSARPL